jgi:CheY-like chemotaxis protein
MTKRVCVVEDDPLIRLDAVMLLEEAGFKVVEFSTVDQAVTYISKHAPEVMTIFTDVRTPGMFDGVTFAQIVAISWPWVHVLVTSGTDSPQGDLPPKADFLSNPWRPTDVLAVVTAADHEGSRR